MTVPVNDRRSGPYVAAGGETSFSYDFKIVAAADLAVWRLRGGGKSLLVLGTDYSVTSVGSGSGGTILLATAALAGDEYLLEGGLAHARLTDLVSHQALNAPLLNADLDHLQRQIVEIRRDLDRAVVRSPFDTAGSSDLPKATAGYVVAFDDDLNLTAIPPGDGGAGGGLPADPLPIANGGTGGDTVIEARNNLDVHSKAEAAAATAAAIAAHAATLGDLAVRDTVATAHIDDNAVTLAKFAHGTAGSYIGFDEDGAPAELQPVAATRTTGLAAHAGGSGGAARAWIVDDSDVFVAGDSAILGSAVDLVVPRRVVFNVTPASIAKVVIGSGCLYILDAAGRVFHLGGNAQGQGGHGDTTARPIATRIEYFVANGITVADVIAAPQTGGAQNYTFFRGTNGKAYAVGQNANGQLGLGNTTDITTPAEVTALGTTVAGIAISGNTTPHTLAWSTGGQLSGAGFNTQGQLGDGTATQRTSFVSLSVTDAAKALAYADASGGYSAVLRTGGGLQLTGHNSKGNLGQGDTTSRSAWTTALSGVDDFALAGRSVIALTTDDEIRTWGGNAVGQLGIGSTTDATSPATPSGAFQTEAVAVAAAGNDTAGCFFIQAGAATLWSAGSGATGGHAGGVVANRQSFAEVVGVPADLEGWAPAAATSAIGLGVYGTNGRAAVAGDNANGELGLGSSGAHALALTDVHLLNRSGPRGIRGEDGAPGAPGADSVVPGPPGADGADGATGATGPAGVGDMDGTAFTGWRKFTWNVNTLSAGAYDAVGNFKITTAGRYYNEMTLATMGITPPPPGVTKYVYVRFRELNKSGTFYAYKYTTQAIASGSWVAAGAWQYAAIPIVSTDTSIRVDLGGNAGAELTITQPEYSETGDGVRPSVVMALEQARLARNKVNLFPDSAAVLSNATYSGGVFTITGGLAATALLRVTGLSLQLGLPYVLLFKPRSAVAFMKSMAAELKNGAATTTPLQIHRYGGGWWALAFTPTISGQTHFTQIDITADNRAPDEAGAWTHVDVIFDDIILVQSAEFPEITDALANIVQGQGAGAALTTGASNTFIGAGAGGGVATGSHNVVIGSNLGGLSSSLANTIILGTNGTQRLLIDSNGHAAIDGAIRPKSFTVNTVPPAATPGAGADIYVSDELGGAVKAFSDGTNWRRCTDRAVIS